MRGCSASGQAEAAQEAGGLVGRNESSGQIVNCRSTATVQADRMAGGVAGQNLGSIVRCRNDGDINTALTDASGSLLGVSLSGEDGASLASVSDIGGIAGRSSGILQSCENTGAVGYASVGSNVGGIVGRTSGYLDGCTNSGTVQGSQEVGGVAGQLEPVLALQYDGGRLDDLYSELDALQGEMDTLLTHTDTGGDSISAALSALTDATRTAKDSTGALADGMVNWADNGIAAVNSTASRFSWAIDQLGQVLDSVGTALAQADAADTLEELFDNLGSATEPADRPQELENLYQALLSCQQARNTMLEARDTIRSQLESDAPDLNTLLTAAEDGLQAAAQAASATQELLTALGTYPRRDRSLARPDRNPANRDGSVSHCVGTGTRRRQSSARSDTRVRERDICRLG